MILKVKGTILMEESFIPSSAFEAASNTVNKIGGQPIEGIKITGILPPIMFQNSRAYFLIGALGQSHLFSFLR